MDISLILISILVFAILQSIWLAIGLVIVDKYDDKVQELIDDTVNKHFLKFSPYWLLHICCLIWPYLLLLHIRYKYCSHLSTGKFTLLSLLHVWVIICLGFIIHRTL